MPNREPHLIAAHVDALHPSPFLEALQLRGWIVYGPQSRSRLANVISAIQTEAADLFAPHLAEPRLHLLREGDCPEAEDRYAEAVFKEGPQEPIACLFKLLKTVGFVNGHLDLLLVVAKSDFAKIPSRSSS
jgi:hypothetical protein